MCACVYGIMRCRSAVWWGGPATHRESRCALFCAVCVCLCAVLPFCGCGVAARPNTPFLPRSHNNKQTSPTGKETAFAYLVRPSLCGARVLGAQPPGVCLSVLTCGAVLRCAPFSFRSVSLGPCLSCEQKKNQRREENPAPEPGCVCAVPCGVLPCFVWLCAGGAVIMGRRGGNIYVYIYGSSHTATAPLAPNKAQTQAQQRQRAEGKKATSARALCGSEWRLLYTPARRPPRPHPYMCCAHVCVCVLRRGATREREREDSTPHTAAALRYMAVLCRGTTPTPRRRRRRRERGGRWHRICVQAQLFPVACLRTPSICPLPRAAPVLWCAPSLPGRGAPPFFGRLGGCIMAKQEAQQAQAPLGGTSTLPPLHGESERGYTWDRLHTAATALSSFATLRLRPSHNGENRNDNNEWERTYILCGAFQQPSLVRVCVCDTAPRRRRTQASTTNNNNNRQNNTTRQRRKAESREATREGRGATKRDRERCIPETPSKPGWPFLFGSSCHVDVCGGVPPVVCCGISPATGERERARGRKATATRPSRLCSPRTAIAGPHPLCYIIMLGRM